MKVLLLTVGLFLSVLLVLGVFERFSIKLLHNKVLTVCIVFQIVVVDDELSQVSYPVTMKLVLDQDEVTKEPLVQVHRNLVTGLKPHQVDG